MQLRTPFRIWQTLTAQTKDQGPFLTRLETAPRVVSTTSRVSGMGLPEFGDILCTHHALPLPVNCCKSLAEVQTQPMHLARDAEPDPRQEQLRIQICREFYTPIPTVSLPLSYHCAM